MKADPQLLTIDAVSRSYLKTIQDARSENTHRAYSNGISVFLRVLKEHWIEPVSPVTAISDEGLSWLLAHLKIYSPSTERIYTQAVKGFYEYLAAEQLAEINLPRINLLIKQRARRSGQRLPQFPRDDIEIVIEYAIGLSDNLSDKPIVRLREMRDRAFLITLADTGLRVHEACKLRRGDIDWNEERAIIIGKGDKQALIRFSSRSMRAIKEYLSERAILDGASGRPLPSLPIFSRHDKGAGKRIKSITTTTGRNIIAAHVKHALGEGAEGRITPHSFRHYFVTTVLRATGNLKLAQALARHASIQVTQRYAHLSDDELDKGYDEIFNL